MFNIGKTITQIRNSGHLFWYRKKNIDYVANGYWVIEADLRDIKYRKILGILVERFGTMPNNNRELQLYPGIKGEEVFKTKSGEPYWFYVTKNIGQELEDTGLMQKIEYQNNFMKIFKGEDYVYVNEKYIEMVKVESHSLKGLGKVKGGKLEPVCVYGDGCRFIVLPIRIGESSKHLREIKKDPQDGNPKGQ